MTVRIDPTLLAALRRRAKRAGRSVSAEVVRLIEREIQPVKPGPRRKTMGMFPNFEAPELEDFKQFRREQSERIKQRLRRYDE